MIDRPKKEIADRARDLFLQNPNQTPEEVARTLAREFKEIAANDRVRPDALYQHCWESAVLAARNTTKGT